MLTEEWQDSGLAERRVLIPAIVNTSFLARVVGRVGKEPFSSVWSNLVWGWCRVHYGKYRSSPGRELESYFAAWAVNNGDKDLRQLVERFLISLSEEYTREQSQDQQVRLDLAESHFNTVLLQKLREELEASLTRGQTATALERTTAFRKIELSSPPSSNILEDVELQRSSLEEKQKVLIRYSGAAGEFFGDEFSENSLVAFMAPPKSKKSWTLLDTAWRGMMQGHQVAYFQVGDMTAGQVMRRFDVRAAYRPLKNKVVRLPVAMTVMDRKQPPHIEYAARVYEEKLSVVEAHAAYLKWCEKSKGRIHLFYHPTMTITALDIRNTLESYEREDIHFPIVILDYAGNLGPMDARERPDLQVAHTWAMLRQISEGGRCVVTADQSNKEGFKTWVLTKSNFGGSKMILAHVTAFLGINQTDEERGIQVIRYNFVVRREDEFTETKCLYASSCLDVANPLVITVLP